MTASFPPYKVLNVVGQVDRKFITAICKNNLIGRCHYFKDFIAKLILLSNI